jgi:malonate transporter
MGVPLLAALVGSAAAGPVIQTIAVDMIFTSSLCLALSRLDGAGAQGAMRALRVALRGMVANPLPWAILAGVLASAARFVLPAPVDKTVSLLADAAAPVALFTIGAVLARSQMGHDAPVPWRDYVPLALAKLLLHPLLVLAACALAARLGFGLEQGARNAVVLVAALPSASNVALLAERYGAHNGRIARIILVSTTLAFLTFSGAVTLLVG